MDGVGSWGSARVGFGSLILTQQRNIILVDMKSSQGISGFGQTVKSLRLRGNVSKIKNKDMRVPAWLSG